MTTIGFIGAGRIGSTVARLSVEAGYDVVLSNSRGPETLGDVVDELGDPARAATSAEAAEAGDLVVLTVPLKTVDQVPAGQLRGKVVLDTCNYYPQRDGQIAVLDEGLPSSAWVQQLLPGARVVKVFNNINYVHLAALPRPAGSPERSVLALAGDDEEAKQQVADFLDAIGYDAFDAGTLAESWRFEPGTPAYGAPYMDGEFRFPPPPDSGRQVTREELAGALAAAVR